MSDLTDVLLPSDSRCATCTLQVFLHLMGILSPQTWPFVLLRIWIFSPSERSSLVTGKGRMAPTGHGEGELGLWSPKVTT